jgi:hypothetical protein
MMEFFSKPGCFCVAGGLRRVAGRKQSGCLNRRIPLSLFSHFNQSALTINKITILMGRYSGAVIDDTRQEEAHPTY